MIPLAIARSENPMVNRASKHHTANEKMTRNQSVKVLSVSICDRDYFFFFEKKTRHDDTLSC